MQIHWFQLQRSVVQYSSERAAHGAGELVRVSERYMCLLYIVLIPLVLLVVLLLALLLLYYY